MRSWFGCVAFEFDNKSLLTKNKLLSRNNVFLRIYCNVFIFLLVIILVGNVELILIKIRSLNVSIKKLCSGIFYIFKIL